MFFSYFFKNSEMAEAYSPPAVVEIEEIDLNPIAEESVSSEPPVNNQVSYYSIQ